MRCSSPLGQALVFFSQPVVQGLHLHHSECLSSRHHCRLWPAPPPLYHFPIKSLPFVDLEMPPLSELCWKMETDKRWVLGRKPLCAMCELKTMYTLSPESSRIDRWIREETIQGTEGEERQSDAWPPIFQGFVIKGCSVVFSVSVTLKVNKTNGMVPKTPHGYTVPKGKSGSVLHSVVLLHKASWSNSTGPYNAFMFFTMSSTRWAGKFGTFRFPRELPELWCSSVRDLVLLIYSA